MSAAVLDMPKSTDDRFCEYISTRIDKAVAPRARAAAAMSGDVSTQEFISNAVNEAAARVLKVPPIKRKPPPPRPKGKPAKDD